MGLKRVRTPHYITGLGDGHVTATADEPAPRGRDWSGVRRRGPPDPRLAAQERFDLYFKDLQEASAGGGYGRATRQHRHPPPSPWHFSAWVLVLAVILMGAFLLHVLSDAPAPHQKLYRRRTQSIRRVKKKTDEWNEDEEDDDGGGGDDKDESMRSQSQRQEGVVDAAATAAIPSLLYYPYHTPEPGLQQHRHRKPNAAPSANASAAATTPTYAPLPQAAANFQQSPQPFAVAAASPVAVAAQHLYVPPQRAPLQRPQPLSAASPSVSTASEADQRLQQTPRAVAQGGLADRWIGDGAAATYTSSYASPTPGRRPSALAQESHLLLSPGHEDQHLVLPGRRLSLGGTPPAAAATARPLAALPDPPFPGAVEETPRIGNQRRVVAAARDGLLLPSIPDHVSESSHSLFDLDSSDRDAFKFAAPPVLSRGSETSDDSLPFPFIPNLQRTQQGQDPPRSVRIDDLHLYQMMESGNVSHWEARVAEESRRLEDRANSSWNSSSLRPAGGPDSAGDARSTDESIYELPSGDPRKTIQHKRTDLTSSTDASASLQAAINFSELKLVDVIGGGGFGQVWRAIWNGTPVAVKILTGSAQSKHIPKPVLQEFVAEINLLKGMRHPNICLYMGAVLEPPHRAIITELAANGSLWDALRLPLCPPYTASDGQTRQAWPLRLYAPDARHGAPPGPSSRLPPSLPPRDSWPWDLVKRVACGAARGMAYLHKGKPPVLHRDLKSANILLDESYTAKVCDFGLSRLKANDSMTGNCGTVQWMAPEVLSNMSYNEKADVYSFGIILWELLSRQCPYEGMTPIQCALAVLNRNQRPEIPKWCPPALQAVIRSCIKREPSERPTFPEIIEAFDAMP